VGQPDAVALEQWLAEHTIDVPADLVAFWRATGGGEAFETEQLLAPLAQSELADSVLSRNRWHQGQGMPNALLVFHEGAWLSALRDVEPRYVTLTQPSYQVDEERFVRRMVPADAVDRVRATVRAGCAAGQSNKGMKLRKLSAAWLPGWTCLLMPAPVSGMDAGTASQLIPGVGQALFLAYFVDR
jgi:hypothetical protein